MNMRSFFLARLSACTRDVVSLVFLVLALLIGFSAAYLESERSADKLSVALVVEDGGLSGALLSESIKSKDYIAVTEMPRERAMMLLRQDRLEAVIIIRENYSESLKKGEFANTVELYSSPSSRAAVTVSEPIINETMILWVQEFSVFRVGEYLVERGAALSDAEKSGFLDALRQEWLRGSGIIMETEYTDEAGQMDKNEENEFTAAVKWYSVFCMFYLIVSASWLLDLSSQSLRARAAARGTRMWKLTLTAALAPLLLAIVGYLLTGTVVCAAYQLPFWAVVRLFVPVVIYLAGVLGMTMTLTLLLPDIMMLLFIAPAVTFLNAVLSGMVAGLPAWAAVLEKLSGALPGRWLNSAIVRGDNAVLSALACAAAWMALSGLFSLIRTEKSKTGNKM